MISALDEFFVEGIKTNQPLHQDILNDEIFIENEHTINYLEKEFLIKMNKNIIQNQLKRPFKKNGNQTKPLSQKLMTGKSFIAFPCSHIHLVNYIWGMLEITPLVM